MHLPQSSSLSLPVLVRDATRLSPGAIVLLNAPVLTAEGAYVMRFISHPSARRLVKTVGFESAIGHDVTARIVSQLLDIECPIQRRTYTQKVGQLALVFRLHERLPEGRILQTSDEIHAIGYHFSLLVRFD